MKRFTEYVDEALAGIPEDKTLYQYKQKIIGEMSARAEQILHSGLKDEQVLHDLMISEYPDLRVSYQAFARKEQAKQKGRRTRRLLALCAAAYLLLLSTVYLGVSFLTAQWAQTWLIMEGGVTLLLVFLFTRSIRTLYKKRRAFRPLARALLALNIFLLTTFLFLCCVSLFHLPNSWMLYLAAVVLALAADAVLAAVTRQKLAILNYLLYLPAGTAILYVLGALNGLIPWHPGWMLMLLAVLLDLLLIIRALVRNRKDRNTQEVTDVWNEN